MKRIKQSPLCISLVIPSYNYGRYLEECLDSILSQNYPRLELVVMDGGSSDESRSIIERHQKHLAYWQSRPDGGQYSAIEEGFRRTSGELMGWLNADDKFHPDAFATVSAIFRRHPEVEWLMGRPNSFDEQGRQKVVLSYLPLNSRNSLLADQELIQQEGIFWRRRLWERSGGYLAKEFQLAADLELWARFFRTAPLYSVDALIAGFRDHPLQKSKDKEGYTAEANVILARERAIFREEKNPYNPPAPLPFLPNLSQVTQRNTPVRGKPARQVVREVRSGSDSAVPCRPVRGTTVAASSQATAHPPHTHDPHGTTPSAGVATSRAAARQREEAGMTTAIEEITTHLTPEEKQALTEMARVADGTTYVELGSYLGASSCYIAAGMPESARLYCIDTWTNDGMSEGRRDTYDEFLKNTREFSDVIVPLRGTTTARAAAFDGEIDFLFVDAGHDYDNVYADVRDWFPKLKQGALVVFHDTGWAEGVQRVVSEQVRPLALREGTLPNMYWAEIDTGRLPRESSRLRSIYNEEFYHEQKDASYRSAEFIVPIILDVFDVTSVTDVGCGVGGWLHLFQRHGVAEIRGYDVNDLAADRYFVDKRVITTNSDFTSASFRIGANSDLLISLEVAEHLPGEEAERFVSHLTQAAPAIIFSAALCGQSGVNHVNEQPPWYWREKFNRRGFVEIDFIRPLILRNEEICWWYRQNITCFVRSDLLGSNAKLQALWRQHPQIASGHKLTVVNEWVLDRILRGEHLAVVDNAKPLPPFLSVIIPTRNRDALLYSALDSLTRQEYPAERFEVIVVDNGSTDATADVCRHFQRRLPRFKVIHDPRPGLHNGRHTGLREATGEILVYADDDVEAFPSWLEGIAEAFADPQVALVGGKILPKFESPPPEWVAALSTRSDSGWALSWYSVLDLGDTPRDIPAEYVWGCNFSIRKKLLEEIGGFHPDSVPQELIRYRGDGETAVSMRIRELGLKARYHPKASVYHLVSSERMTADYLYRRAFNQGVSDSYASIRRTKSLSRPLPYQGASGTIHETVNRGLVDGFNYHQQMVQADSALQRWVLKEHYLAEEGTIFAEPQLAPTAAAGSVWGPQEP